MLFTGQEYCKILNKNCLTLHPRCITCCLYAYFADLRRFQRVIAPLVFHSKEEKFGKPDARSEKSELEMVELPQIQRGSQAQMPLFRFSSLATQSGPCDRRQAVVCFHKSKVKRW